MSPNSWFSALLVHACLLLGGMSWGPRLASGARIVEESHFSAASAAAGGAGFGDHGDGGEELAERESEEATESDARAAVAIEAAPPAPTRDEEAEGRAEAPAAKAAGVPSPRRWRAAAEVLADQAAVAVARAERAGEAAAEAVSSSASAAVHAVMAATETGAAPKTASDSAAFSPVGLQPHLGEEGASAEVELEATAAAERAEDGTSAEHVPAPGGSEAPTPQAWAGRLGIPTTGRCSLDGAAAHLGCAAGCACSWDQQCYPKFVYVDAGGEGQPVRLDVGTCEAGMPLLVFGSLMLFLATLLAVVVLRLWLLGHIPGDDGGGGEETIVVKASPRVAGRAGAPVRGAAPAHSPRDREDESSPETSEDDVRSQGSRPQQSRQTTPPTSARGGQPPGSSGGARSQPVPPREQKR